MINLPRMALSIRQPWCWAILSAGKDVENRDWYTKYRGPVCIHASLSMTKADHADFADTVDSMHRSGKLSADVKFPAYDDIERGGIVGVVDIVDCVTDMESDWFFGRYGFVLRNARPVPLITVKGALGFFPWQERLAA